MQIIGEFFFSFDTTCDYRRNSGEFCRAYMYTRQEQLITLRNGEKTRAF